MTSSPLVMALPAGARVVTFADGCREAALDFVNSVALRASKEYLVEWLHGPYRAHVVTVARSTRRKMDRTSVLPAALAKLLAEARLQVMSTLLSLQDTDAGVGFGYEALASGLVYRCQDASGAQGWVPVAHPRMRLADRVLSLVAADHLLRAGDYESLLFQCSACELVAFDGERRAQGVCGAHARSDIRGLAPVSLAS